MLTAELTAINQYFIHAKMCDNWGYERLAEQIRDESIDEMKHAERVIERILFLEGVPNLQRLGPVRVGETVPEQFELDLAVEVAAVERYNRGIALAVEDGDNGTRELLEQHARRRGGATPTGSRPSSSSSARSASRTTSPPRSTTDPASSSRVTFGPVRARGHTRPMVPMDGDPAGDRPEPTASGDPRFEQRPWGSLAILDDGDDFKVKRMTVDPGQRLSYQSHARRAEHWVVVSGAAG